LNAVGFGLRREDRRLALTFGARDICLPLRLRRCDDVSLQRSWRLFAAVPLRVGAGLHTSGFGFFDRDADVLQGAGVGQRAGAGAS
jgi:hypothetical protein